MTMMATIAGHPLIEARGITKRYGAFELRNVSFMVEPGEVVGFVGRNGAGKSTTIKALLGLIGLDGGEARVFGMPVGSSELSTSLQKERIGVVLDSLSLPLHLSVAEVGRLMDFAFDTWDMAVFEGYLVEFGLDGHQELKRLSRGMSMKLGLACALAHDPEVLILDEATAGLDPMAREEVLDILRAYVAVEDESGNLCHAILMSSHITSDLERIADRVVGIDEGRIVLDCVKDDICDKMGIARCREADLERLLELATPDDGLCVLQRDCGIDVMVLDRFGFASAHPEIPCERMTIDDYMAFILKGSTLKARDSKGDDRR